MGWLDYDEGSGGHSRVYKSLQGYSRHLSPLLYRPTIEITFIFVQKRQPLKTD